MRQTVTFHAIPGTNQVIYQVSDTAFLPVFRGQANGVDVFLLSQDTPICDTLDEATAWHAENARQLAQAQKEALEQRKRIAEQQLLLQQKRSVHNIRPIDGKLQA